jgi:hypothetical protein
LACGVTKCGRNINGSTIRTRTKNSYSPKEIERHGIGKPIGTTKSIDRFVHLFKPRAENQRNIQIHILHHRRYQWVTTNLNIINLESTQLHQ